MKTIRLVLLTTYGVLIELILFSPIWISGFLFESIVQVFNTGRRMYAKSRGL